MYWYMYNYCYISSATGMFHTTGWTTYTLFNLDVCRTCGSYQCPFCPWYNQATVAIASWTMITAAVMMTSLRIKCLAIS